MATSSNQDPRWQMIRGAAAGNDRDCTEFARVYSPLIRSLCIRKWRGSALKSSIDDVVQEVLIECLRPGGALGRFSEREHGFRSFLGGIVQNICRRVARRRWREQRDSLGGGIDRIDRCAAAADPSQVIDRATAIHVLGRALRLLQRRTDFVDGRNLRGSEILRLRFAEGLPIRAIAAQWNEEPAAVHLAYRKARRAYKRCLHDVVARRFPGSRKEVEAHLSSLLASLL